MDTMRAMDGISLLVGIALGGGVFAAVGYWFAMNKARSLTAIDDAASAARAAEVVSLRTERDTLRVEGATTARDASAAKALLEESRASSIALQTRVDSERTRAEEIAARHSQAQAELREMQARITERESAMEKQLAERERSIEEMRKVVEQSRETLRDTFAATGAELLKATGESLVKQAKEQFEGQSKLSAQELESRQKSITATLDPLREQLVKQEELMKSLGEKREGDTRTLAEQLRQIAELQQRASTAAQTLSSALRDNRQRGQWGEVSLHNIAEMAGLVENVDFTEQTSVDDEEGNRLRPDMTVRLPGGRFVPIDAKVPMNAYLDSLEPAHSDAERAARRSDHAQALRNHVRMLASREYAKAMGEGVEITVLFVPLESGLIAALEEDATIYREALDKRIIITTASTLLCLLRTCAMQWQQSKLNENARKIGENAKELLERIQTFAEHLESVGAGINAASKGYNKAVGSFNSRLLPSARSTAELAGELTLIPAELSPAGEELRELQGRALPDRSKQD